MKRRPDQSSSIAQTLLSTRPAARAGSITDVWVRSVSRAEEPLGQAIQRVPSPTAFAIAGSLCSYAALSVTNQMVMSRLPRLPWRRREPPGRSPMVASAFSGASTRATVEPAPIPSLRTSGVPDEGPESETGTMGSSGGWAIASARAGSICSQEVNVASGNSSSAWAAFPACRRRRGGEGRAAPSTGAPSGPPRARARGGGRGR